MGSHVTAMGVVSRANLVSPGMDSLAEVTRVSDSLENRAEGQCVLVRKTQFIDFDGYFVGSKGLFIIHKEQRS